MRAEPGNSDTLAQWAERVYVSERTLARQFIRETGISFGEWRQRLRFLAAIEQLETRQSIKEIAFYLGYSSPSALSVCSSATRNARQRVSPPTP